MNISNSRLLALIAMSLATVDGLKLWTRKPANPNDILMSAYVVGNGKQGGMPLGIPGNDIVSINHDSLWTGGPFSNTSYRGGNPTSSLAHFLPGIQSWIFQNGTGNESALYGSSSDYGSYETFGNLTVAIAGVEQYSNYKRVLDLETAVHSTAFTANGADYSTQVDFLEDCLNARLSLTPKTVLPDVTFGMVDTVRTNPVSNSSCSTDGVHFSGRTEADAGFGNIGMKFDAQVQALGARELNPRCNEDGTTLIPGGSAKSVTLLLATGTEYDASKGDALNNYSFRGHLPYPVVMRTISKALKRSYSDMLKDHVADHQSWMNLFRLELPDPSSSADVKGDPFVENLVVDYGKYMYIASSRPGSLPPNLQGTWAPDLYPAWSSDYHIDINVQMNNWHAEQMGLGNLTEPLFDYMTQTLVPRGTESARLWYNASGWVAFSNVNTFGHTGQENDAVWSDAQHDVAWLMAYVWDRFDYGRDVHWYRSVGYPLIKAVAEFWLDMLLEDGYFKDGTLVANPCNSPEQPPTTFGCSQSQQVIWELFDHVLKGWEASGDTDECFLRRVKDAYEKVYQGVRVGSWGQIQEWKIDMDVENNTHRHLSHLTGWYPGYVIAGLHGNNKTITDAVATSLYSRGNGTIDSNTGWEKAWRSACWARLGVVDEAYSEFKYTIDMNFAPNVLSVYATTDGWPYTQVLPFQIDANFGLAGAALSMLSSDVAQWNSDKNIQRVILGPSIPPQWASGSVKGLRLRGGGTVDFTWDDDGMVSKAELRSRDLPIQIVNKAGKLLAKV
ncbi:uncharacterized protein PFLUO_LOCUS1724 [Penicillium psychrofluorescens]|uniref:uncharacterized protein n=1 Tax=Penicillium psychrofluorescens TaxID=3158075 RepID=UPI003CCD592C